MTLLYQIWIHVNAFCRSRTFLSTHSTPQAAQVQEVLPHIPRGVIEQDLRRTANPLATIDNLLQSTQTFRAPDNQIQPPPPEEPAPPPGPTPEEMPALPPPPQFSGSVTSSISSSNLVALQDNQISDEDPTVRRRRVLRAVERRMEFPRVP